MLCYNPCYKCIVHLENNILYSIEKPFKKLIKIAASKFQIKSYDYLKFLTKISDL